MQRKYRPELQSLRGIASLAVLVYHCLIFYRIGPFIANATETILNPHAQVMLFFVMSSFVLTSSLHGKPAGHRTYIQFLVRRGARIYPALWISVVLAYIYYLLRTHLPVVPDRSAWMMAIDAHRVSASDLIGSLVGARDSLVPPLWSIKVELLASLLVPGLAWLASAGRRGRLLLYGVAAFLALFSMRANLNGEYLVEFAFGAIVSSWTLPIHAASNRSPRSRRVICVTLVLAMLLFRNLNSQWKFDIDYHAAMPALIEGAFAAWLLTVLETSDLTGTILLSPLLVWFGDISYSIYLLHFPVMQFSSQIIALTFNRNGYLGADLTAVALTAMTIGFTLPLSHLCYRQIELRGIAAGAWFISRMAQLRPAIHHQAAPPRH